MWADQATGDQMYSGFVVPRGMRVPAHLQAADTAAVQATMLLVPHGKSPDVILAAEELLACELGNNATSAIKSLLDSRHVTRGNDALSSRKGVPTFPVSLTPNRQSLSSPTIGTAIERVRDQWSESRPVSSGIGRVRPSLPSVWLL